MPDRASYEAKQSKGFEQAFKRITDLVVRGRIPGELQSFMGDWKRGATVRELAKSRWQYKPLKGSPAKRWGVKQIYVLGGKYRVALVDLSNTIPPCIWFVHVFKKTKGNNKDEVDQAIEHARRLCEGEE